MAEQTTSTARPVGPAEPAEPAAPEAGPRRVEVPARRDKLRIWLLLIITVGLCCPALLIDLGRPDTTRTMEKILLTSSQETWFRQADRSELLYGTAHGETESPWLLPTWNGRPRVNKPPLAVWVNMLAWSVRDPAQTPPQVLVLRARLAAAVMVVLALASTFWIGYSLGDLRTAALAALVTGTCLLLVRQGRIASYDTHLLGWTALAVAAGMWAMRPLKPINWVGRRVTGWLICGLAVAGGILTKGPLALVFVVVPLLAVVAIIPMRRIGNALGLLFALLLGGFIAAPWYLWVMEHVPSATEAFLTEYTAARQEYQMPWYYLGLFALVFPWPFWLVGALFQPFLRARGEQRRQLLIGWVWFVGLFILLSIPGAKQQRYIVPLLPAVGLLVAQLWSYHAALADQRTTDMGVNLLRIPHWVMLIGASLAAAPFWAYQREVVDGINGALRWAGLDRGLDYPRLGQVNWYILAPWGVALIVLAVLGLRWHMRWKPMRAGVVTALWMVVFSSVVFYSYARSKHHSVNPVRDPAAQVRQLVGQEELVYLYDPTTDPQVDPAFDETLNPSRIEPNEEFLFYTQRIIPPAGPDQLAALAQRSAFVIVRVDENQLAPQRIERAAFQRVFEFNDHKRAPGYGGRCLLYRSTLTPPKPQPVSSISSALDTKGGS